MKKTTIAGAAAVALGGLFAGPALADGTVYARKKTAPVSYGGQTARHALHDSLKKLAASGNGKPNPALKAKMMSYYAGKDAGRKIVAPASAGKFAVLQGEVDALGRGANLAGKTHGAAVAGMPNGMTGPELIAFWIDKASSADKGFDAANGYDYGQLISKFVQGAVFYNQAVESLDAGTAQAWDAAFGCFGAPAHALELTPKQVYDIAKRKDVAAADRDKDGKVDLKTEMTFGPAYYAAGFDASVYDKGDRTSYLHTIARAFLDGRKLLASAKGGKLSDARRAELRGHARTISDNWEKVLAEATFKYAGSVYKDMVKLKTIVDAKGDPARAFRAYAKHWGELKGFSLALQAGKTGLGETATRLNRAIGAGPLLLNASQTVDIDSKGNYVRDQGPGWGEYMLHMAKVQKLLVEKFGVKARNNDVTGGIEALSDALGGKASAEND